MTERLAAESPCTAFCRVGNGGFFQDLTPMSEVKKDMKRHFRFDERDGRRSHKACKP